ncbi:unnamed protein product [Arabidopsis lyrata]|uniref:Predicted protein n=1 Tax=Arabidopsis lyrata subsp. lyrata TaxID=81972 RepID=D7M7H1_ARALL|nr:predicted protein [Arabidopsis lyrata subsp. lyrata]CAH8271225.1 unnamed protein product [Arabidopsis lyrata]
MAPRIVLPCTTTLYVLLVTLVLSLYLSLASAQRSEEEEESIICPYNDKGCLKYLNEFAMEHINNHYDYEAAIASLEKEFQDRDLIQKPYMHMTDSFLRNTLHT